MSVFTGIFRKIATVASFLSKSVVPLVNQAVPASIPFTNILLQVNAAIQNAEALLPAAGTGPAKSLVAMTILEQAAPLILKQTEAMTGKPLVDQAAFEDFIKLQTDALVALYKAHGVQGTGMITSGPAPTNAA